MDFIPLMVIASIVVLTAILMIIACSIKSKVNLPKFYENVVDLRTIEKNFSHDSISDNAKNKRNS